VTAAGRGGPATSDEQAALTSAASESGTGTDPQVVAMAREIAARLALRRPRRAGDERRASGADLGCQ
jgi:hypothetical protein